MKDILLKCIVLASVLILVVSCANSNTITSKDNKKNKTSVSTDKNPNTGSQDNEKSEKTIQTYLKSELTGPNEELKKIIDQDQVKVNTYIKKHYKTLFIENNFESFVNTNLVFYWLIDAYRYGYQLKPKNIEIQKIDSINNAYDCKVIVEYSKGGETKTATVTEIINTNEEGKISAIRDINDGGLRQKMKPSHKGQ